MQQPYALTLTEAARFVRLGQLSPIELVNASLERIDRLDGAIKAWVAIDRAGALNAAAELEQEAHEGRAFAGRCTAYRSESRTSFILRGS